MSSEVKKNGIPTSQVFAAKTRETREKPAAKAYVGMKSGQEKEAKAKPEKTVGKAYPVAGQIPNTLHIKTNICSSYFE